MTRREWTWVIAAALVAGALRAAVADNRGFWLDEYYTLRAAQMPVGELIRDRLAAGHSPLYFLYAKLGALVAHSEPALRVTSALMVSAAVVLLGGIAQALELRRHLLPMLAVAVAEPAWFTVGTEYRYMMMAVAATAAVTWACARYARAPSALRGCAAALGVGFMLWIHSSTQFVLGALLVFFFWEGWDRFRESRWRAFAWAWPLLLGLTASLPLLYLTRGHLSGKRPLGPMPRCLRDVSDAIFGAHDLWTRFLGTSDRVWLLALLALLGWALWRTRAALRASGNGLALRLMLSLLLGIPAFMLLFSALLHDVQGIPRYLAPVSLAGLLILAIAWHAPGGARARTLYRAALGTALLIQASATALERGDRHREALRWLVERETGSEPVFMSTYAINSYALGFLGLPAASGLHFGMDGPRDELPDALGALRRAFDPATRGFVVLYHGKTTVQSALDQLRGEAYVADWRRWNLGGQVQVMAIIRDAAERAWLDALPAPPLLWGPAEGDNVAGAPAVVEIPRADALRPAQIHDPQIRDPQDSGTR